MFVFRALPPIPHSYVACAARLDARVTAEEHHQTQGPQQVAQLRLPEVLRRRLARRVQPRCLALQPWRCGVCSCGGRLGARPFGASLVRRQCSALLPLQERCGARQKTREKSDSQAHAPCEKSIGFGHGHPNDLTGQTGLANLGGTDRPASLRNLLTPASIPTHGWRLML